MIEKLFVYGTLGPKRANEKILTDIGGSFEAGMIKGVLRDAGWGADMGYPGIDLDEQGDEIEGFIFSSAHLEQHWHKLDAFEGEGYQRVLTEVIANDGTRLNAYVYILAKHV